MKSDLQTNQLSLLCNCHSTRFLHSVSNPTYPYFSSFKPPYPTSLNTQQSPRTPNQRCADFPSANSQQTSTRACTSTCGSVGHTSRSPLLLGQAICTRNRTIYIYIYIAQYKCCVAFLLRPCKGRKQLISSEITVCVYINTIECVC